MDLASKELQVGRANLCRIINSVLRADSVGMLSLHLSRDGLCKKNWFPSCSFSLVQMSLMFRSYFWKMQNDKELGVLQSSNRVVIGGGRTTGGELLLVQISSDAYCMLCLALSSKYEVCEALCHLAPSVKGAVLCHGNFFAFIFQTLTGAVITSQCCSLSRTKP